MVKPRSDPRPEDDASAKIFQGIKQAVMVIADMTHNAFRH